MLAPQSGVAGRLRPVRADDAAAQVDVVTDFVAANPALVVLVAALLGFVFFMFLFVRRILTGLREGFDDGYRGK